MIGQSTHTIIAGSNRREFRIFLKCWLPALLFDLAASKCNRRRACNSYYI